MYSSLYPSQSATFFPSFLTHKEAANTEHRRLCHTMQYRPGGGSATRQELRPAGLELPHLHGADIGFFSRLSRYFLNIFILNFGG